MSDIDQLLESLTSEHSTPQQRGLALRALRSEEAPTSWLPDEALTGATVGSTLGMMTLPLAKPVRKLSEKLLFKKLAAHRAANPGDFVGYKTVDDVGDAAVKTVLKPTSLEGMNTANMAALATLGAAGGGALGAGIGYAATPEAPNYLESGKLDEPTFKAMLKVLTSSESAQEDKAAALAALTAQGTKTRIGASDLGQSLALGALGTLIGGYAGQKAGRKLGAGSVKNSEIGALADSLLGHGARNRSGYRTRIGGHMGEGVGDVVGGTLGGVAPFLYDRGSPAGYAEALNIAANSEDPTERGRATQRLEEGYEKTTNVPSWGEALGGGLGAMAGLIAGYALRAKGGKGVAHNLGQGLIPVGRKGIMRSLDLGLGGGYGAAAGTALGTVAGASYNAPFKDTTYAG